MPPTLDIVVKLADPTGAVFTALQAQLVRPWDESYAANGERADDFDVGSGDNHTTLLRVGVADGQPSKSPIDLELKLPDSDGRIRAALEAQLVEPWKQSYLPGGVLARDFRVARSKSLLTLVVVVS